MNALEVRASRILAHGGHVNGSVNTALAINHGSSSDANPED